MVMGELCERGGRVGQYDQIRITESNKLAATTIGGTRSMRQRLMLNIARAAVMAS